MDNDTYTARHAELTAEIAEAEAIVREMDAPRKRLQYLRNALATLEMNRTRDVVAFETRKLLEAPPAILDTKRRWEGQYINLGSKFRDGINNHNGALLEQWRLAYRDALEDIRQSCLQGVTVEQADDVIEQITVNRFRKLKPIGEDYFSA